MANEGFEVLEVERPPSEHSSHKALDEEPTLSVIKDHFTLPASSNLVRFRSRRNAARVYTLKGKQMVLQEIYDEKTETHNISMRRLNDETIGVSVLRLLYTIVTCLFAGFFFVFCLQVLLFLVLDLAVESGATQINGSVKVGTTIGVVFAIIVFVRAFSEAMVIAGQYIADMWTGHFLAKKFLFSRLNDVATEWIFFVAFLLSPLLVMCFSLLAGSGSWWSNTAIVWFGSVMGFFIIFCFNIVFYEVKAAYQFVKNRSDTDSDSFLRVLMRCILLRQRHKYSGKTRNLFLARSYFTDTEDTEDTEKSQIFEDTRIVTMSTWAKMTQKLPAWLFIPLENPHRLYTIEDVQDYRPFLTSNTWGLEKIFCRPTNSRYIAIVEGSGAVTQSQLRSSLVCSLIGTALGVLILVSLLVWFQIPGIFVFLVFVIAVIFSYNSLGNTRKLFRVAQDILNIKTGKIDAFIDEKTSGIQNFFESQTEKIHGLFHKNHEVNEEDQEIDEEDDDNEKKSPKDVEEGDAGKPTRRALTPPTQVSQRKWDKVGAKPSEAIYMVCEYKRVNKATKICCLVLMAMEIGVFYVFPLSTLFSINWNLGVLFFVSATVSGVRHYIHAAAVIEETGNIELVGGSSEEKKWENQSRLNNIVGSITVGKSKNVWMAVLGALGFAIMAIFLGAVGSSIENTDTETFAYLPNFYYLPLADDMRYPTCTMSNMNNGFGPNSTLLDFAFMSSIAYQLDENTQPALDSWFGPSGTEAIHDIEYVNNFREENDQNNSAVFFKMFRFPQQQLGMIVVRGTTTNWDMLADVQLWSAAALMQGLRFVLPMGEIWTPIIDQLVNWINTLEAESIAKVSFYKLTTAFAEYMKNDSNFASVQVTGHSLGGGLSIITGAQAKIPAVGLSGPNALLSGRSFDPVVSAEDINKYTFNIVPRRDIVPMLDDLADQFQYIRCESGPHDFIGCHFAKRSVCEIMYTCGTGGRPALCDCHLDYGYPKPLTEGDEDFDEVCGVN